jgi:hypothetical protein
MPQGQVLQLGLVRQQAWDQQRFQRQVRVLSQSRYQYQSRLLLTGSSWNLVQFVHHKEPVSEDARSSMPRTGPPIRVVVVLGFAMAGLGLLGCVLTLLGILLVHVFEPACPAGAVCDGTAILTALAFFMAIPVCLVVAALGGAIVLVGRRMDRNRAL